MVATQFYQAKILWRQSVFDFMPSCCRGVFVVRRHRPFRLLQPIPILPILSMNHAKIFSLVSFVLLIIYGSIGFYFLPMAGFQGELTRMGLLPESQYGPRQHQPIIAAQWFQQSPMREAEVLVIGDSFSAGQVWQSELVRHGIKIRTENWNTIRGVCEDFMPWLRSQGFQGKFVVLEMVERNIPEGLRKSQTCRKMDTHINITTDIQRIPPPSYLDPDVIIRNGRLSLGIQTAFNAHHIQKVSDTANFQSLVLENGVIVATVKNGCKLFSHRRCSTALFLQEDQANDLSDEYLNSVALLNVRLTDITPIWVFVPNKSTTYFYSGKQFWNKAETRFNAPNLLRINQQALTANTTDLYPANDSHLSSTGYLLMGQAIYSAMQTSRPLLK